jgi:putative glycosyltransferase (TIGR04372 family)
LTFREIIKFEDDIYLKIKRRYLHDEDYWKAGLKVIENTPEEILDLVKEMNQRLDGTWKMKEGDAELQKEFKSLFKKDSPCYGFPSMIGTEFLRKNKELLK